jgi:hypothetical protein
LALLAVVDDAAAPDVDPGAKLVRGAEGTARPQTLEIPDRVRGRVVVPVEPEREGDGRKPGDGFGRNPRERGDGRLDPDVGSFRTSLHPMRALAERGIRARLDTVPRASAS